MLIFRACGQPIVVAKTIVEAGHDLKAVVGRAKPDSMTAPVMGSALDR